MWDSSYPILKLISSINLTAKTDFSWNSRRNSNRDYLFESYSSTSTLYRSIKSPKLTRCYAFGLRFCRFCRSLPTAQTQTGPTTTLILLSIIYSNYTSHKISQKFFLWCPTTAPQTLQAIRNIDRSASDTHTHTRANFAINNDKWQGKMLMDVCQLSKYFFSSFLCSIFLRWPVVDLAEPNGSCRRRRISNKFRSFDGFCIVVRAKWERTMDERETNASLGKFRAH